MAVISCTLQWRGQKIELSVDRENDTIGSLVAQIRSHTTLPPERMTIMVAGWRITKQILIHSQDHKLAEFISETTPVKGTLLGTPSGQEFARQEMKLSDIFHLPENHSPPRQELERGYMNLGNTCYMNAVLALLENVPEFVEVIKKGETGSPLSDAWGRLWRGKQRIMPADPRNLFEQLCRMVPEFGRKQGLMNTQQDADECLTHMLSDHTRTDWKDIFTFKLQHKWLANNTVEEASESETLKLGCYPGTALKPVSQIAQGLELGFIETVEKWNENLQASVPTQKVTRISALPKYMIVHMVRFEWKKANDLAGTRACRAKVLKRIEYPHVLNIYEWCTDELKTKLQEGRTEDELRRAKEVREGVKDSDLVHSDGSFELKAVLTHRGRTVEEGHYICWNWHQDMEGWVKLDDDKSSVVPKDAIDLQGGLADGHAPYILLYQRRGTLF